MLPVPLPFVTPSTRTTEVPQAASAVNNENGPSQSGARIAKILQLIFQVILQLVCRGRSRTTPPLRRYNKVTS